MRTGEAAGPKASDDPDALTQTAEIIEQKRAEKAQLGNERSFGG
jgi:hypothetical protein